jgi:predicted lactoylglutathione lyase
MDVIKISDSSVEVTKEIITPTVTTKQTYERDFIEKQIKDITAQRDALIAIKEAELKECQDILNEMDRLGVKLTVSANEEPLEEIP